MSAPVITGEESLSREADSIVSRRSFYGSVSGLMVNMAEQGKLTEQEKRDLMELAERLAKGEV